VGLHAFRLVCAASAVAAAFLALAAPAASGQSWQGDWARAVEIARDHWGGDPPCSGSAFPEPTSSALLEAETGVPALGLAAWAFVDKDGVKHHCRIAVDSSYAHDITASDYEMVFGLLCGLIVHEYGHLHHGAEHSDDPADVMHELAPPTPACVAEGERVGRLRLLAERSGRRCDRLVALDRRPWRIGACQARTQALLARSGAMPAAAPPAGLRTGARRGAARDPAPVQQLPVHRPELERRHLRAERHP
jgi:hypothetical protein